MGLFSSKTEVTVATSVSRVIEDRLIPNSVKTGAIKGIMSDGQLVENILEDLVTSLGSKGERLYRYGKTAYPYGIPTSHIYRSSDVLGVTAAILKTQVGAEVILDYAHYAPLNIQHYAWQHLFDAYGYDPQTNELTQLSGVKGFKVFLEDIQVNLTKASKDSFTAAAMAQWGAPATVGITPVQPYGQASTSHTPINLDPAATEDYLRVSIIWADTTPVSSNGTAFANTKICREDFTFPMVSTSDGTEFVQAKYHYQRETGRKSTWTTDSLGNPEEVVTIQYSTFSGYFTYQIGSGTHEELDVLFNKGYDDLGSFFPFGYFRFNKQATPTSIYSTEYKAQAKLLGYLGLNYEEVNAAINTNPSIDDVDSALMMFMVPASSTDVMECKYLFDFFKQIYLNTGMAAGTAAEAAPLSTLLSNISNSLFRKSATASSISLAVQDKRFVTSLGFSNIYRKIVAGNVTQVGNHVSVDLGKSNYAYRKQITPQLYEEILVTNLRRTYNIDGGHSTVNNMVPLDHAITKNYSIPEREHLYSRSLHYVFNSRHETEVAWYQQGWFGTSLIVIAVVWTIGSMGLDGGSGLGAAIAAGTATAVDIAIAIAIMALEYVVVKTMAKLFVKLLGPEFAMALAVVAAIYGMYSVNTSMAGSLESMTAKNLLSVANNMISEVGSGYQKEMELLRKEYDQFNLFAQNKMDELEKIQEELEGSRLISPFVLFGEAPDTYFNRTVHSGNIGIQGIEAISSYCDMSLKLPTIDQTLSFGETPLT